MSPQKFKMSPRSIIIQLLLLLAFFNFALSQLINDPVAQLTSIQPYPTALQFEDAYFDISFKDGGALVQVDNNATYYLSRISILSYNYFQFVQVTHTTQAVLSIYTALDLTGYEVYGMCQTSGTLDYVVALHVDSGEIRVMRTLIQQQTVQDYKVVDKEASLQLQGNILVDCKMTENYLGINTYTIAIGGSYLHSNAISSYYLAKFSTKYNLTEYFIKSEYPSTMENPKLVRVDKNNQMIYIALEINKNIYHGSTVYQPGNSPGSDNANVAIVGYSWTHGVRLWVTVLGDATWPDTFGDMEPQDTYLYVVVNSYSTTYSTNSSQRDINYYKLRTENGYIQANTTFGSPYDDVVFDLEVSYNGIYLLALINGPFLPHRMVNKQWGTQNSKPNLAIILIDFTDQILQIEGYDISLSSAINPYPVRFFLARYSGVRQNIIFINHRSNNAIDLKGGIFITYITSPTAIFSQVATACSSSCARCNPEVAAKCLECKAGYFLYQHTCYQYTCPQFSYSVTDSSLTTLAYCKSCHYACKTCSGPQSTQCTTCCANGACGPTYDRTPSLGTCTCPTGTTEANGACNFKCILNQHGKRGSMCYPQCPYNSYPLYNYAQATQSQERTQFDSSSPTDCTKYTNMLSFTKTGKGIQVQGPSNLAQVPQQFTLAFWVMPTSLNSISTLINAFGRIKVLASASTQNVQFQFVTGATTTISPTYSATASNYQLTLNVWNYISVSQREYSSGTTLLFEQQFAMAQGNFGTVYNAGYKNTDIVVDYSQFTNSFFLGANSDISPMSFTGYLKEVKFFSVYHGFYQMQDEMLRLYRYYSYDDPNLIAYWKLSEPYTQSANIQYTIKDYSATGNSFTFSNQDDPDYPVFLVDTSNMITFCLFHDVAICKSVDYSQTVPIAAHPKRFMAPPTFILNDLTQVKANGDQIWFMPNNTNCTQTQILAEMNYSTAAAAWIVPNATLTPLNLLEGTHYQVCYFDVADNVVFNLMQLYVASKPRTVDPSNGSIYNRTDNVLQWMTGQGDQAYGDVIRFMSTCTTPQLTETEIMRSNTPDYPIVNIMQDFALVGSFYFCWLPTFTQDYMTIPYYEPIHNLQFMIQYEPTLNPTFKTTADMNEDMIMLDLKGTFIDGDQFRMAWQGLSYADCNPINYIGNPFTYNHSQWPGIWMGYETGIFGVTTLKNNYMDELQFCWQPAADQAPSVFIRIKKYDLSTYFMRLFDYANPVNMKCPELLSFNPAYGSADLYQTDRIIQFNFKTQAVVPAKPPAGMSRTLGQFIICRGGVASDGTFMKISTDILWQNLAMDDAYLPDPYQQGGILCSQTGQCEIILDPTTSSMLSGEIYFMQFFPYSWATINNGVKYYLFNNKPISMSTSGYDHLFFCRSFDIQPNLNMINGNSFTLTGTDLLYKTSRSKYSNGQIVSATFQTKAINIKLTVYNTDSSFCTVKRPTATVAYQDIHNSYFTVSNLVLRECNEGTLFMDIEVIRGIRDQYGAFTYIRSEKLYNIEVGTIGCDSSCLSCSNTTANDCIICSNSSLYIYNGACLEQCPSEAPYYISQSITFQTPTYIQMACLAECPYGYYGDPETGECLACNSDCLTCNSSVIASCLSCNPVQYLYNGICVTLCPSPHHVGNYTDYTCRQISAPVFLQVKIQSLGYINRIPKSDIAYLKSDINNTGGGSISSIVWTQLTPDSSISNFFSNDTDGTHDRFSQNVRLSTNALLKLDSSQVVKVQVTVTNTAGDIAYDIYEFYTNDVPTAGKITLSFVGEAATSVGSAIDSLVHINMVGWSASANNGATPLKIKVFVVSAEQIGLSLYTHYMTLTDQLNTRDIYFRLPVLSNYNVHATVNITVCVSAEDIFFNEDQTCVNLFNINNKLTFINNYTLAVNYLNKLNLTNNLTTMLHATQVIYMTVNRPNRPNSQPVICTLDQHCGMNGYCLSNTGVQKCECFQGYFGTNCDFQGTTLENFQVIVMQIIDYVYATMTTKYQILAFDIEVIANIVRGFTTSPDLVNDVYFEKLLVLLELASNANLYSHKPLDTNTTMSMIDAYANAFMKILHSYKQKKAMPDTSILGLGDSILDEADLSSMSQFIQNRRILSSTETAQEKVINLSKLKKESLIGQASENKKGRSLYAWDIDASIYQQWGRRMDVSFNQFLDMFMLKLDPTNNQLVYKTYPIELQLNYYKSTAIASSTMYIQTLDAFWMFPSNIWQNQQGLASPYHDIKQKMMKYILNPFYFETNANANLESNITSVKFYTMGNAEIPVNLTNKTYVEYREPFNNTFGYDEQLLKCMTWDETHYKFINDQSCSFSLIYSLLPCTSCDAYSQVNVTVSSCRCSHLSRFGVVTELSSPLLDGAGQSPGIYSDFYALAYWRDSFGYLAVIAGIATYFTGQIAFYVIDRRMQRNLIIQLKEKVRKFEIQFGNSVRRLDGLFFKSSNSPEKGKGRNATKKKVYMKTNEYEEEDNEGLMNEQGNDTMLAIPDFKRKVKNSGQQDYGTEGGPSPLKIKGKKKMPNKKFNQEDLVEDEPDEQASPSPIPLKGKRKFIGKKKNKTVQPEIVVGNEDSDDDLKRQETMVGEEVKEEDMGEEYHVDDYLTEKQKDMLRRQQNVLRKLKKEQTEESIYFELMAIKFEDVQSMTKKEFKRKIASRTKKLTKEHQEIVEDKLQDLKDQLNSTDEEITNGLEQLFREDKIRREEQMFKLRQMIIDGSYLLSLLYVTSILSPRHVRWSLVFSQVCMNWFVTAVFFNNTKNPLAVPNFSKNSSSLAFNELWISFLSPFGSMILMYLVASFLKISNSQIYNCATTKQVEQTITELKREMKMKFFMGYSLCFTIFTVIFVYLVTFSANFGWKISWVWFWAGLMAIVFQIVIIDPLFSIAHWGIYKLHPRTGRILMNLRALKQGHCEVLENPFEEEDKEEKLKDQYKEE